MVEMINALTGTRMAVAEGRVAEYLSAGHRRAEEPAPEPLPQPAADAGSANTSDKPEPAAKPSRTTAKSQASTAKRKPAPKK